MIYNLPNMKQMTVAADILIHVLTHVQHFCKSIEHCEYVGKIERFNLSHYIFKFRESGGPWYIGVCGGFTSETDMEPIGYIGTDGSLFQAGKSTEAAISMLDHMHEVCHSFSDTIQNGIGKPKSLSKIDPDALIEDVKKKLQNTGHEITPEEMRELQNLITNLRDHLPFSDEDDEPYSDEDDEPYSDEDDPPFEMEFHVGFKKALPDLSGFLKKLMHSDVRPESYEKSGNCLVLHYSELVITVLQKEKLPKWRLDVTLPEETLDADLLSAFAKHTASLLIVASGTESLTVIMAHLGALIANEASLLSGALFVRTPTLAFTPKKYRDIIGASAQKQIFPMDAFVHFGMTTDACGYSFLRTYGMGLFGIKELTSESNPDKEWKKDLRSIATDLLFRNFLPTEDSHTPENPRYIVGGQSGYSYTLRPGRWIRGLSEQSWQLRRTGYFWMDDIFQIADNLDIAGVDIDDESDLMNRMAAFLLWAQDHQFLAPRFRTKMERQRGYGKFQEDIRTYLFKVSGSLDTRIFKKEIRPFVENYYNRGNPTRGYFRDVMEIALSKILLPKMKAQAQKAGIDAIALLPWSEDLCEEIKKRIDTRYEEYLKK